jgi:hypothetical protein
LAANPGLDPWTPGLRGTGKGKDVDGNSVQWAVSWIGGRLCCLLLAETNTVFCPDLLARLLCGDSGWGDTGMVDPLLARHGREDESDVLEYVHGDNSGAAGTRRQSPTESLAPFLSRFVSRYAGAVGHSSLQSGLKAGLPSPRNVPSRAGRLQIGFSGHFDPIFHKVEGFCISPFFGLGVFWPHWFSDRSPIPGRRCRPIRIIRDYFLEKESYSDYFFNKNLVK